MLVLSLTVGLVPPFILVLIPFHAYVTFKLARNLDKNGLVWSRGTLLPYAGLLVLIILNLQGTSVLRSAGLHAPPFWKWRWAN